MRTEQQMTAIITRAMRDLHRDTGRKWGFPSSVLAGATLGLGVTLMLEDGRSEEEIVEIVRHLAGNRTASPGTRGAS